MTSTPYTTTDNVNIVLPGNAILGTDANSTLGFYGAAGTAKPTITGVAAAGSSIKVLITALAALGLVIDGTTLT